MSAPAARPRVSVVVPTFDARALLTETLAAVSAQTFTDFELLVIDDGSTDDTADYLTTLTDPRLRVVRQPNGGVGAARNRGIDEAVGEFVAFCDHDDLWLPGKLATQVAFMDAHAECVACVVPWAYSTDPAVPVYTPPHGAGPTIERPLRQLAQGKLFLITSALMVRRTALDGLRYFTRPRCIEDTPLQVRLLCRGPMGLAAGGIQMLYRWHADNYSTQADFFDNGIRLLRELDASGYFDSCPPAQRADLRHFFNHIARTATLRQAQAGDRRAVRSLYRREWRHQIADGAVKYLAAAPLLLCAPAPVLRRLGVLKKA